MARECALISSDKLERDNPGKDSLGGEREREGEKERETGTEPIVAHVVASFTSLRVSLLNNI